MREKSKRAANYIKDALIQFRYIGPRLMDLENQKNKMHIFYSVDTDVIKLFSNPSNHSKYVEIFNDNNKNIELARMLSDYIFFNKSEPKNRLIIFPPHAEEFKNICLAVAIRSEKECYDLSMKNNDIKRVKQIIQRYKKTNNKEELLNELEKGESDILNLIYGSDKFAVNELRQLSLLISNRLMVTPEYIICKGEDETNNNKFKIFTDIYKNRNKKEIERLSDDWFERLKEEKNVPNKSKKITIYDDAKVLGTLEWMNRRLEEKNSYTVLITGDKGIEAAADKYIQNHGKKNFAMKYIRHPRAFIAELGLYILREDDKAIIYEGDENKEINLVDWLYVFLTPLFKKFMGKSPADEEGINRGAEEILESSKNLDTIARKLLKEHKEFHKLGEDWRQFTKTLFVIRLIDQKSRIADKALENILLEINEPSIKDIIRQRMSDAWETFFIRGVEGGDGLISTLEIKTPSRSVPCLRFKNFPKTQKYINRVFKSQGNRNLLTGDNGKLLKELKAEDFSNYSYYLAVGLFYASIGEWRTTRILAMRSFNIATNRVKQESQNQIVGNEAAYLLARAYRLTSRIPNDLKKSKFYLNKAYDLLRKLEKKQDFVDIRFESESCAIDLAYHLFKIFMDQKVTKIVELQSCADKLRTLLDKIEKEEDNLVRFNIERLILTDLFMVFLLLRAEKSHKLPDANELRDLLTRLKNNFNHKKKNIPIAPVSFRVEAIYMTALCVWEGKRDRDKTLKKLRCILKKDKIKEAAIMPYDEKRYKFLKEQAFALP